MYLIMSRELLLIPKKKKYEMILKSKEEDPRMTTTTTAAATQKEDVPSEIQMKEPSKTINVRKVNEGLDSL